MSDMLYTHECLGFALAPGVGPVGFARLVKRFGDPKKAFNAPAQALMPILGDTLTNRFLQWRGTFSPSEILKKYHAARITTITPYSSLYPPLLKEIADPPICLFALQKDRAPQTTLDALYIAVVGSRRHSAYGKVVTSKIVTELSQEDVVIVSGLALGIDALAHEAAIEAGGKTIAVLGCGVDVVYPPFNRYLYERIIASGNTILSELPPGTQPSKGSFVMRNRIVSGICKGVIVIEGTEKSGSLITAKNAAYQGRDVFAVPGHITSDTAQAPLLLLKQGAKLVTSGQDVLSEYGIAEKKNGHGMASLTHEQTQIMKILGVSPRFVDEIAIDMRMNIAEIMTLLSLLEIEGLIEKDIEGKYASR